MFPGKGNAMKAGLREVVRNRAADIVLFLDADISNLTSEWIDKLVNALIQNNCDMSEDSIKDSQEMLQLQSLLQDQC